MTPTKTRKRKRRKRTPLSTLDAALRRLLRVRRRLEQEQGRIARRNARRSFGAQLGAVRAALDKEFPRITRAEQPGVSPQERQRRAERARAAARAADPSRHRRITL